MMSHEQIIMASVAFGGAFIALVLYMLIVWSFQIAAGRNSDATYVSNAFCVPIDTPAHRWGLEYLENQKARRLAFLFVIAATAAGFWLNHWFQLPGNRK